MDKCTQCNSSRYKHKLLGEGIVGNPSTQTATFTVKRVEFTCLSCGHKWVGNLNTSSVNLMGSKNGYS